MAKLMRVSSLVSGPVQTPATQLARPAEPHGYRVEGDTVHLNARFALLDPVAHDVSWALQLWACPSAAASVEDLADHIVAEAALPPMGEIADESEHVDVNAFAWPPAGDRAHVMILVLAPGRPGEFNVVHDIAVYPCRQQFAQPRIGGNVDFRIDGERAQISVERIENPRPAGNHSGTMSLELWALSAPFTGGLFEGHHLAGVEVGSVDGQGEMDLQPLDLSFIPPPTGRWQFVLMLREWTAEGFVTRDFTNLAMGLISAQDLEPIPAVAAEENSGATVEGAIASVAAKAPTEEVVKGILPGGPPAKAPTEACTGCVSVNTARVEQLPP